MLANIREITVQVSLTTGVLLTSTIDSIDEILKLIMLAVSIAYTVQRIYMTMEERREKKKDILLKEKKRRYEEKKIKLKESKILEPNRN